MQSKPINRRRSRAVAMELLYSGTVNARSEELSDDYLEEFTLITDTREGLDLNYIRRVVELAEGRDRFIKGVISPFLKDWGLNRVSRVNLAILRVSATELLFMADDIPARVSVNEAIELARTYSDEESTAFINGVLDKILKALQEGLIPEWTKEAESEDEPIVQEGSLPESLGEEPSFQAESMDTERSNALEEDLSPGAEATAKGEGEVI